MYEIVDSAKVSLYAWAVDVNDIRSSLALSTMSSGKLTLWSVEDEKRYQTLLSKGRWETLDGVNTKVEVTSEMFSKKLKELIEKKRL